MKSFFASVALLAVACSVTALSPALARQAKIPNLSRAPHAGAIVMDADSGAVISEERADTKVYPASVVKLMDLLLIVELVEKGKLSTNDVVKITKEAHVIGGTGVWLDPRESFTVDELVYAMMLASGNDAATALAIHIAGSKEAFVTLMNQRAKELGMVNTLYTSVHGLPPDVGQQPDISTARDQALLAREMVKHPEVLRYTATKERDFREKGKKGYVAMRNHNRLLWTVDGCDGLKTGFFDAAGFSLVATVRRNDRRIVVAVMDSKDQRGHLRDKIATELISKAFLNLPLLPPPPPTNAVPAAVTPVAPPKESNAFLAALPRGVKIVCAVVGTLLLVWLIGNVVIRRRSDSSF